MDAGVFSERVKSSKRLRWDRLGLVTGVPVVGAVVVAGFQLGGCASLSAIFARSTVMSTTVPGPRGSDFQSDHSLWPITDLADQPCALQMAVAHRTTASTCLSGHGSLPSPRLTHSAP